MTIASAQTIAKLGSNLIDPFWHTKQINRGLSFGLSAAGYDIRIGQTLWLFRGSFCLAVSVEKFNLPRNMLGVVHDKSTLARQGLFVQNTIIEPGWSGWLTLEITYHRWKPLIIHSGTPIAQIVFHILDESTDLPYNGKYQNQPKRAIGAIME